MTILLLLLAAYLLTRGSDGNAKFAVGETVRGQWSGSPQGPIAERQYSNGEWFYWIELSQGWIAEFQLERV